MHRLIVITVVALGLSACAQDNGASVDYGARQRALNQRCGQSRDIPECEAHAVLEARAAILECQMQGQMAASNASAGGGIVGGAIYGAATGNQIYSTCLRMKAAQLGY